MSTRYNLNILQLTKTQFANKSKHEILQLLSTPITFTKSPFTQTHTTDNINLTLALSIVTEIDLIHNTPPTNNSINTTSTPCKIIIQPSTQELNDQDFKNTQTSFKCRLHTNFLLKHNQLLNHLFLPPGLQIVSSSPNTQQTPIVFFNRKKHTCPTHFDRDNSILYILNGQKEILLAHRQIVKQYKGLPEIERYIHFASSSGLLTAIYPFDEDKNLRTKKGWKCIILSKGESIFIPKNIVHCIRSKECTLAISFQVQIPPSSSNINNPIQNTNSNLKEFFDFLGYNPNQIHGSLVMDYSETLT